VSVFYGSRLELRGGDSVVHSKSGALCRRTRKGNEKTPEDSTAPNREEEEPQFVWEDLWPCG
jgi:hypothetical protein